MINLDHNFINELYSKFSSIDFWKLFQNFDCQHDQRKLAKSQAWWLKFARDHSPIFGVSTCVLGQPISRSPTMPRRNPLRYASHAVSTKVRIILEIPRIHVVPARTCRAATVPRTTDRNGMLGTDRVPVYRRFGWHFHFFVPSFPSLRREIKLSSLILTTLFFFNVQNYPFEFCLEFF